MTRSRASRPSAATRSRASRSARWRNESPDPKEVSTMLLLRMGDEGEPVTAMGLDWPTLDPSGFRAEVVRIAGAEWRRWHPGGTKLVETDPTMTSVLQDYYATGIGEHVDAADLQDSDWQAEHLWSAVFISWVMRQAGAGSRFRYAASHQRYIAAAKANREAGDVNNPFWAFRLDELPPEVGDLVGAGNSGATYANIAEGHFD